MGKIVQLTQKSKPREPQNEFEEGLSPEQLELVEQYYAVEEEIEGWQDHLLEMLDEFEIGDDTDEFWRDFGYAIEAFRSLFLRSRGLVHPWHPVVDKIIQVETEDGVTSITFNYDEDVDTNS